MGKKQRKKRLEAQARQKSIQKRTVKSSPANQGKASHSINPLGKFLLFTTLGILCSCGIVFAAYSMMPSYKWVWDTLLISNLNVANENQELSIEEKHEIRQGFTFRYLNFVNENTPDSAVILMPHDSLLRNAELEVDLSEFLNRNKVAYFTYPRKIIYDPDRGTDSLYKDKATHVAILNYHGYDNLPYTTGNRQQFAVLPINPSQP
jgi:hypothetical protein